MQPPSVPILVLHSSSCSTSFCPDLRDHHLRGSLIYLLSPAVLPSSFSPRLFTPSGFSHEACKNTCALQPFAGEHKCTNAGMSVGPQSDEVNENVTLKRTNQLQTLMYTAEFYNVNPSCLWIFATEKQQHCRFSHYDITLYTKLCATQGAREDYERTVSRTQ